MKIKINLQIFIIAILFYCTKQIEIYSILMLFALVHEIGHMIAGIAVGLKPKSLTILPFGVSIHFEKYAPNIHREQKKIIIAMAGPCTNLLIACLAQFITNNIYYQERIIYANILVCIFNLFPIYPLDGGRIIKSILSIIMQKKQAEYITNKITKIAMILLTVVSSIAIIYLKNIAIFIIIIYLWSIVIIENRNYRYKEKMYDIIEQNRESILSDTRTKLKKM